MRRRFFLKTVSVGALGMTALPSAALAQASEVRIRKIETFPILYPMKGRFKFFEGPPGRPSGRPAVMVKITATDGTIGWGQSVPIPKWSYETVETVVSTIQHYLAPELIGQDPFA